MSFGMTNITTEAGSNGRTGALFEGLAGPADSTAALKRSMPRGVPRVQRAVRNQVELRACDLDSALPAYHQARAVWAFVQSSDLQALYARIRAVQGSVGRAPIDPAILMSLWLYATLDGVGSARELDQLCDSDDAYRWLCGGVGVNHHTLGDFRIAHAQWLDGQLTRNVAALLSQGLVSMNRVAHDGMRVRAHAGAASFRRRETLQQLMQDAQAQVQALKQELGDDPGAGTRRVRAARQRAADLAVDACRSLSCVLRHPLDGKKLAAVRAGQQMLQGLDLVPPAGLCGLGNTRLQPRDLLRHLVPVDLVPDFVVGWRCTSARSGGSCRPHRLCHLSSS